MALSLSVDNSPAGVVSSESYVYLCNSESATKYHLDKGCRGLNSCNHGVVKVTFNEAVKKGKKTLCGWED